MPKCLLQYQLLLLVLLLQGYGSLSAQQPQFNFTQYNIKDGLAGSIVHGIDQDKDGFIWFATETGLSRFDGKYFKNYTTADGIPSNEVLSSMADAANNVWIQTFKNAVSYYHKGHIYNATNHAGLSKLNLPEILGNQGTNKIGQMTMTTNNRIMTFDFSGNCIKTDTLIYFENNYQYDTDSLITAMRNNVLDFISENKYWMQHKKNNALEVFKNTSNDIVIKDGNKLIISNWGGPLYQMPLPKGFLELRPLNTNILVLKLLTGGCLLLNIHHPQKMAHCLPQERINQAYADTEGNFWFSTQGSGVFKLGSLAVRNYQLLQAALPQQVINISKYNGQIYIGADNGQFWQMDNASPLLQPATNGWQLTGLGAYGRSVRPLLQPGRIFNPDQQLYNKTKSNNKNLGTPAIKTLSLAHNGLLAATSKGVFCYEPNPNGPIKVRTIFSGRSTCALQVGTEYFIGTLNGLYMLDSDKQVLFAGNIHPALGGRIGSLELSSNGTLWIASYSDGIVGWRNGKVTAQLTTATGLSSNNCRTLFVNGNTLWVGTEKGLNKIDISSDKPIVLEQYGTQDGLASDMINTVYIDGLSIYAGTSAGLSVFKENELERQPFCRLNLTGIYVSGKPIAVDTPLLVLPHADNNIRFEYAGISFRSEGRMRYRYRLIGLDSIWQTTTENTLSFPSLASGDYTLELQAINAYGLASNIIQQHFSIKRLLIEKIWFQIASLLMLALLVGLLFHWRLQRIQKKERQQRAISQRLSELENMALRSQINPHFIFNSLNAVYQYVMDKDLVGANRFITDFSQLIRLTFELTALPKITVAEELQYLRTFLELESTKYEGQFSYTFSIMPGLDTHVYFLPPLLLQPYVENSIRHGLRTTAIKGQITIAMDIENNHFICTIDDNGIGRKAAQAAARHNSQHHSRGMSLTAERIAIWSRQAGVPIEIKVIDKPDGQGTCIRLSIPIQEALNPY
jgi:Histidine kinase/Y_Y_Y domain